MKNAEAVLAVKFNSSLSPKALNDAVQEGLESFRNVPGLIQKYYLAEERTGAISGIYLFETRGARAAFWASDLAKNIPAQYGVILDTLRVEQYELTVALNEVVVA